VTERYNAETESLYISSWQKYEKRTKFDKSCHNMQEPSIWDISAGVKQSIFLLLTYFLFFFFITTLFIGVGSLFLTANFCSRSLNSFLYFIYKIIIDVIIIITNGNGNHYGFDTNEDQIHFIYLFFGL